jgi:hypothetical protein
LNEKFELLRIRSCNFTKLGLLEIHDKGLAVRQSKEKNDLVNLNTEKFTWEDRLKQLDLTTTLYIDLHAFARAEGVKVLGTNSVMADINFQKTFGSLAIVLIIIGLIIACLAFLGWCSNCCGGYNIIRILVNTTINNYIIYYYLFSSILYICTDTDSHFLSPLWGSRACRFEQTARHFSRIIRVLLA